MDIFQGKLSEDELAILRAGQSRREFLDFCAWAAAASALCEFGLGAAPGAATTLARGITAMSQLTNGPEPEISVEIPTVDAVHHVRLMRGESRARLFLCSDRHFYVVKFRNNPQHPKLLANEMIGTILAAQVGLPVPKVAIVNVRRQLVRADPDLTVPVPGGKVPCESGLQFGSRYAVEPDRGHVLDHLPSCFLKHVLNAPSFLGMLAFDKWAGNVDSRQAVFWRQGPGPYSASFIDQGNCFDCERWRFRDIPLHGAFDDNEVYSSAKGWGAFEPWLSRIELMDADVIKAATDRVPVDWYDGDWRGMERLVHLLSRRRKMVRDLIVAFRGSPRRPFPNWSPRPSLPIRKFGRYRGVTT